MAAEGGYERVAWTTGEQQAARAEKARQAAEALQARRELAQQSEAMRRDLAGQASADRRMIAGMIDARREQKNIPKLPTSALKMQQEELVKDQLICLNKVITVKQHLNLLQKIK
jgi:hypothetical protein